MATRGGGWLLHVYIPNAPISRRSANLLPYFAAAGFSSLIRRVCTISEIATQTGSKLRFVGSALPVFGRYLGCYLGSILVIPAPWLGAWLLRWIFEKIEVEDGTEITFEGRAGEIWLPIMLMVLLPFGGAVPGLPPGIKASMPLLLILVDVFILMYIVRWYVGATRINGTSLTFEGSYWSFLGYYLLYFVSIFTIIGWAWVLAAGIRWYYRSIDGSYVFSFTAKGHDILWRTIVAMLAIMLIIPIPWVLVWMTRWPLEQTTIVGISQEGAGQTSEIETQDAI